MRFFFPNYTAGGEEYVDVDLQIGLTSVFEKNWKFLNTFGGRIDDGFYFYSGVVDRGSSGEFARATIRVSGLRDSIYNLSNSIIKSSGDKIEIDQICDGVNIFGQEFQDLNGRFGVIVERKSQPNRVSFEIYEMSLTLRLDSFGGLLYPQKSTAQSYVAESISWEEGYESGSDYELLTKNTFDNTNFDSGIVTSPYRNQSGQTILSQGSGKYSIQLDSRGHLGYRALLRHERASLSIAELLGETGLSYDTLIFPQDINLSSLDFSTSSKTFIIEPISETYFAFDKWKVDFNIRVSSQSGNF